MGITPVEPILDQETIDYIDSLKNKIGKVTEKDVQEFVKYAIKDGDKVVLANFISRLDSFSRTDKRFIRARELHKKAMLHKKVSNPKYIELFKEASVKDSEMSILIKQRVAWSKQNP